MLYKYIKLFFIYIFDFINIYFNKKLIFLDLLL